MDDAVPGHGEVRRVSQLCSDSPVFKAHSCLDNWRSTFLMALCCLVWMLTFLRASEHFCFISAFHLVQAETLECLLHPSRDPAFHSFVGVTSSISPAAGLVYMSRRWRGSFLLGMCSPRSQLVRVSAQTMGFVEKGFFQVLHPHLKLGCTRSPSSHGCCYRWGNRLREAGSQ